MDFETAKKLLIMNKPVMFEGKKYSVKELVIWYDNYNTIQYSFILYDENKNTYRVNIRQCFEVEKSEPI